MRLLLVVISAVLVALATVHAGVAAPSATSISGGRLPHAVRLTQIDEVAFMQRVNVPPALEEAPATTGDAYVVTSPYWETVLRAIDADGGAAETAATYYPAGGFVRARQGGSDVWLAIDNRQRAILDRYARLGQSGALPAEPGQLEVLAAAAASGDSIGIAFGSRTLTAQEAVAFWTVAAGQRPSTPPGQAGPLPQPPMGGSSTRWIVMTMPEGRSVQYLYSAASGTLLDVLGTEWYAVPARWLVPVLGEEANPGPQFGLEPGAFPEHEGRGSPVWWLLAAFAGVAAIGGAFALQRRLSVVETSHQDLDRP